MVWGNEAPSMDHIGTYWWLAIYEPGRKQPREAGIVEIGYQFGLLTYAFHGYEVPLAFVNKGDGLCINGEGHLMRWCGPLEPPLDEGAAVIKEAEEVIQ